LLPLLLFFETDNDCVNLFLNIFIIILNIGEQKKIIKNEQNYVKELMVEKKLTKNKKEVA